MKWKGQHVISRKIAGVSAASVGAATAAAALLLGTVPGSATPSPAASAYGIAVRGVVAPIPQITTPPDGEDALLQLPPPLGVGVLRVAAAGDTSAATAASLDLLELVRAQLIRATCDQGVGAVSILNGSIAGVSLPSAPSIGEGVDVSPILSVVLNRQTDNPDGTRTVDAVVLTLLSNVDLDEPIRPQDLNRPQGAVPNVAVPQSSTTARDLLERLRTLNPNRTIPMQGEAGLEVVISSATCGREAPVVEAPVVPAPIPPQAPRPEMVETRLPVTH